MIKVIIGNQFMRSPEFVSPNTTIRTVLGKSGIDCAQGKTYLIGCREIPLTDADFDKSFADFGIVDGECRLYNE